MIANSLPLVYALIGAMSLLAASSDNEIDPDVAVRGMENITARVLQYDENDQRALRAELSQVAARSDDKAYKEFVRGLPDMLGLAE